MGDLFLNELHLGLYNWSVTTRGPLGLVPLVRFCMIACISVRCHACWSTVRNVPRYTRDILCILCLGVAFKVQK